MIISALQRTNFTNAPNSVRPRIDHTAFETALTPTNAAEIAAGGQTTGNNRSSDVDVRSMSPAQMEIYAQKLYDAGKIDLTELGILSAKNHIRQFGNTGREALAEFQNAPIDWMQYIQGNLDVLKEHGMDAASSYA